jgi:signal transduction histidine kinase
MVELSVSDTGCGMDAGVLAHVFEPFFSTRSGERCGVARATGLGLSVSKSLIEQAGGTIGVESELGKGTTVTVRLPAVREKVPASPGSSVSAGESAQPIGAGAVRQAEKLSEVTAGKMPATD